MSSFTCYLAATAEAAQRFSIRIFDSPPPVSGDTTRFSKDLRYSPIMPAFLSPGKGPSKPGSLKSVALLFSGSPYKGLADLKSQLRADERTNTYFSEGLASIILLNVGLKRIRTLREVLGGCSLEFWQLKAGMLDIRRIVFELPRSKETKAPKDLQLQSNNNPEVSVYAEQISASLSTLWASYGLYFPSERETLRQLAILANNLVRQHELLEAGSVKAGEDLARQKRRNAIISALVEISAALSYAVTQGTSGSLPVLSNRSPFPHHSLLGIGGAVRALTKYTRYLESAFMARSVGKVIAERYSTIKDVLPARIPGYNSGPQYRFENSPARTSEYFDVGGEFRQEDHVPLITHFSLRHGFMESKFSVTAASEALTAETLPQWTLMTLSHEIMHSRVRAIFQALFGKVWGEDDRSMISQKQFDEFCKWLRARKNPKKTNVVASLRNVVLNFCFALEEYQHPRSTEAFSRDDLNEMYSRHKYLAMELFVHFHDYYFVYARQPKMYIRSLWASWIKVAAPYARPLEYLIRSLATVACGSGLSSIEAFNYSRDILLDGLNALEAIDVKSPLFGELRRLVSPEEENMTRAFFAPCYYLIDTVNRYFASRTISSKIDRIESDPFAEGSTNATEYSANIYVFGENQPVSPIRFSLASLFKTLSGQLPVDDRQWLTAWNYMVISS